MKKANKVNETVDKPFQTIIINKPIDLLIKPIYVTKSTFCYGFWEFKFNKDLKEFEIKGLNHGGIHSYLANRGYFKRYLNPQKSIIIKQDGFIIDEVSSENLKADVFKYVDSVKESIFIYQGQVYSIPMEALRTFFLQHSNNLFTDRWLEKLPLHKAPILKDTKYRCYFIFKNCLIQVSKKDGVKILKLNTISELCIWRSQSIDKHFSYLPNCLDSEYAKFCINVTSGVKGRFEALRSAIGYLTHFFNPSISKAVILSDEELLDHTMSMGGTGKSLFAKGISEIRSTVRIDGRNWNSENRFKLEMVKPLHQVVWIDDAKKEFDLENLFSCLTDGWAIERKYNFPLIIKAEDSPKILIIGNNLRMDSSSHKRRMFVVELNDFYRSKSVEDLHGIIFSNDWKQKDWNSFFSFMIDSTKLYLDKGLVGYISKNINRIK